MAVTRARDVLEINLPQRYVLRQQFRPSSDRHLYAPVSRFLTDGVQALMDHQQVAPPMALDGGVPGTLGAGGGMDAVDQFLSGLWA